MLNGKNLLSVLFAALLLVGCGGGGSGDSGDPGGSAASVCPTPDGGDLSADTTTMVINSYVDDVVIATYRDLRNKATALRVSVETLQSGRNQANLDAAQAAWVAARVPWEQSEAWLFGPVDSSGYDPALDSWPVNRTDLDEVLNGNDALTEEYIAALAPDKKGFHTVEYLLYGIGLNELQDRHFSYLIGTAKDIESTAIDLHDSWTEDDNPYGERMKSAGDDGNTTYPSQTSALEEIVGGMMKILDEVGAAKIAEPYDDQDTEDVESQFSFNSRADFANNIVGVLNVWMGCRASLDSRRCSGTGLDDLVRGSNSALATRVETEINDAIDKILAISQPFRDAILDPSQSDEIEAAQDATDKAFRTLRGCVLELIRQ